MLEQLSNQSSNENASKRKSVENEKFYNFSLGFNFRRVGVSKLF
jgi:hypothetical protein